MFIFLESAKEWAGLLGTQPVMIQLVDETLYEFRFAGFYQENKVLMIFK